MTEMRFDTLYKVRADWLRVQGEVAYLRMLFAASRYLAAVDRERRFNPFHDEIGRFTTADDDAGGGNGERPQLANRRTATGRVAVGGRYYNVTPQQERELISAAENAAQAVARVRSVEEGWQSTAGPFITDPNSAEGAIRIYRDLAQEANGRAFVLERGGVPLGFNSRQEFQSFGWDTRNVLVRSGNADAEPYLRGSAVTGYSYTSGAAFDSRTRSDYDFAIVSSRLLDKATDLGIPLIGRGSRTWPLTPDQMRRLGIDGVNDYLGTATRRDTSIVIFRDVDALRRRGPNLQLP